MSARSKAPASARNGLTIAVFAAVVLSMPFWLPLIGGYEALATKIVIWAIFAVGFDILLGFTGYLSFGHAAFFGTSAYTTGLMLKHVSADVLPAMGASILVTVFLAFLLGVITLRRAGIYFAILTLAFAQMFHVAALSIFQGWTGGDNGLTMSTRPELLGIPMTGLNVFYFAAAIAIVGFYIALRIRNSPFGLMLRSIKSNAMRLEYTGVYVRAYKQIGFMISAVYAGVAGSLMVIYEPYVATKFLHWSTSGEIVIMSVIGGVGTLIGPMLGATFMLYFQNVVQAFIGEQWKLVLGIIFMLVVIFMPGGFMEGLRRLRGAVTPGGASGAGADSTASARQPAE
ncbi:branched-chain amino acid ABC transporter permease [Ferruginivarius sediminum]|uniref:Branched-chain amino acid ABC transporter permease n=1 Tax=Ferruginivarius sediminum TaxID=2661937 RepID=A0A369TBG7_9PROT|nr:branched-chain amino acid ABC transporter permease [Ferruginivarius sediminum]RDD61735.1 branched-chain amino acid ABC transporter permease [Ferruginivarius sediminum]